jgi:hypothetical protein
MKARTDSSENHWLDRFAVRLTRRQALTRAVAGAAALQLLRPVAAEAASATDCQKGCNWTSHQVADSASSKCLALTEAKIVVGYSVAPLLGASFLGGLYGGVYRPFSYLDRCMDNVYFMQKDNQARCDNPYCPGFNPRGKSGPCEGVVGYCCPCGTSDNGYIPCVYDCNDPNHDCCPSSS